MDRAADNHYPTMNLAAIKALKVPAADDAVLFMWATAPMLPAALDVIAAWGFESQNFHVWGRDRIGTGYWVRGSAELLLVATRGQPIEPAPGQQLPAWIEAPRGEHSEKPEIFVQAIERLWPNTQKLEMFARRPRSGWDAGGNEIGP